MSIQLEALADEVFGAAAAQGRVGAQTARRSFGELVWNPEYPDLSFLNGIADLVAPEWTAAELEHTIREFMPAVKAFRAYSRDPHTIASLGALLTHAGYRHEVRIGMIQAFPRLPPPLGEEGQGGRFSITEVADNDTWMDLEALLAIDNREHEWSPAQANQYLRLCHWRAAHTTHRYFVASADHRPVGHVGLFQHGPTAYLHGLYTRPDARRRGVGRALTLAMTEAAASIGCDRVTLQCTDDGYLPGYYGRLGYRPVGEQHIWTRQG